MVDRSRRFLLRGALPRRDAPPPPAPRPPWALRPDGAFTDTCSRCGDCLRACPRGLLVAGDGGFPEIRFDTAGCDLCGACADACPRGAIVRGATGAAPFDTVARIATGACLAHRRVECRVCGEACDARALRVAPRVGGVALPVVDASRCTGCGECVAPCPVRAVSVSAREPVTA